MTLGQFFLGIVAIAVATVVYRWQKSIDRRTKIEEEMRQHLISFMALSQEALFLAGDKDVFEEGGDSEGYRAAVGGMTRNAKLFELLGYPAIANAAADVRDAVVNISSSTEGRIIEPDDFDQDSHNALYGEFFAAEDRFLIAVRDHVQKSTDHGLPLVKVTDWRKSRRSEQA